MNIRSVGMSQEMCYQENGYKFAVKIFRIFSGSTEFNLYVKDIFFLTLIFFRIYVDEKLFMH